MSEPPHRYTAALAGVIETRWQDRWEREHTFDAPNPAGPWAEPEKVAGRPKLLVLDMFPYPSGAGLHVGHPLGYIATDVYARFGRMTGHNVLHCLGYDSFGLPAEQYAVQTGQHPRITTEENIATMRRQLRRLGLGHDDRRALSTIDPDYYRWTQWIYLQLFESWYDPEAGRLDGGLGRARPIAELIKAFDSGERTVPDGRSWSELDETERSELLMSFRLAYVAEAPVNWCPGLGTVLANEEVTNGGRSERGNFPVFQRNLSQQMMRITAYADRLVDDLDRVDWPDHVKAMQANWIGRSQGARIAFPVGETDQAVDVFTTRPDTVFGATFLVLAPEHPLLDRIIPEGVWADGTPREWAASAPDPVTAVGTYRTAAGLRSELERQADGRQKTGVFTGAYATNPVNGSPLPIFIADYVLMGYGTGAIMAVPGQDARDWEFAETFQLPIIRTIKQPDDHPADQAYAGDGEVINSTSDELSLDGCSVLDAGTMIIDWLERTGHGQGAVSYKLRDWLFSRQRYWGEPFPIVYDDDGVACAVPDATLPVELPDVPDYAPRSFDPDDADSTPEPPLGRAEEWVQVELDLGDGRGRRSFRRETNTMPNWAGSCWYFLRYLDPANVDAPVDPDVERYWMGAQDHAVDGAPAGARDPGGADLYIGGVEHAVLHLLYARFWHKVLFDLGHISSEEPFRRYFSQGYLQAYAYRDSRGQVVPAAEVVEEHGPDGEMIFTWRGQPVQREYGKIGKSLKNAISPDDLYDSYGADTFRVYEMSMGPLEHSKPWDTRAVVGAQRFLRRIWRTVVDEWTGEARLTETALDDATERLLHRTIDAVRADYARLSFNTAVARLTELINVLSRLDAVPRSTAESLALMVAPLAPHVAEELWARLGHQETLTFASFPEADPDLLITETVTCVIQVNGKVRDRIEVPVTIAAGELQDLALAQPKIISHIAAGIRTVIVREPRLVNVVPNVP